MKLNDYVTLGRSGLRVSPLCLGTMTFGTSTGWGMEEAEARAVFEHYLAEGGNFFDCANSYAGGTSEEYLGRFIRDGGHRDRAVIATKFTRSVEPGNPNAVGNGRKTIHLSLEQSLRRLSTDYIDLYWLHSWDRVTPVEEVVASLNQLVQAGKILHYGLSDVPAWYAARAATIAELRGLAPPAALQLEYSLVERAIEREHVPAAQEMGMAICAWGPTGSGFLTGKYRGGQIDGAGRLNVGGPTMDRFSDGKWAIAERLESIAKTIGRTPAQVAINWVKTQPGQTTPIVGARTLDQLRDNLAALDFDIPVELRAELDQLSALPKAHPYRMFEPPLADMLSGGVSVMPWRP